MQSGEQAKFSLIYESHAEYVRTVVRRLLKDPAEVEDVVHDVFLQAWRHMDRFDPRRGELRGWLTVIARSRALDRVRRLARRRHGDGLSALEPRPPATHDPRVLAELSEGATRLHAVWGQLPPLTRQVLELAYYENVPQRAIAARLDLTLGVVKSRLAQGLALLRSELHRPAPALPSIAGVHVLVIDDDGPSRQVLGGLLSRAGASPILRRSAAEAFHTLDAVWPNVLLASVAVPPHDGSSLIRRVRALASRSGRRLPAIALTEPRIAGERARTLDPGFALHVPKPPHPLTLLTAIARLTQGCEPAGPLSLA